MFWSCWVVWHVVRATSCQISKYWGSSQIFPHYFCERKQIEQLEEARFILQENTAIAPVLPALPQRDGWKHWLSTQLSHSTSSFTCFPATLLEQYYFTAFTMVSLSERLHSQVHPAFLTAPQSSGNVCWNQCPHIWWGAGKKLTIEPVETIWLQALAYLLCCQEYQLDTTLAIDPKEDFVVAVVVKNVNALCNVM